ncbi:YhzD-like protein [Laceyella sacchari]|jgi:YhzD-like protein|uniref:YhzD family protein n=1 Tax=Laceyella sacchari TaxID=37482 RepID=UPI001045C791|nr:YhzD family protein [Laceyella sacchari]TCW40547.1 YhzD-like protein [Laceyella sacchari]
MYHMTVYSENGEVLIDQAVEATTDTAAKQEAHRILQEKGYETKPHRVFHRTGRLVMFKPHQFDTKTGKATI